MTHNTIRPEITFAAPHTYVHGEPHDMPEYEDIPASEYVPEDSDSVSIDLPPIPDPDHGPFPATCDWDGRICTELARYHVITLCENDQCAANHEQRYCLRHFALALGEKLYHMQRCHSFDDVTDPERIKNIAISHVAAFSEI